jgi:hypothetical protein
MVTIPRWVLVFVAFWVLAWGAYRVNLGIKKLRARKAAPDPDRPSFRKKGLFARGPRTDILYGIVFLILGAYLTAMGFGIGIPR